MRRKRKLLEEQEAEESRNWKVLSKKGSSFVESTLEAEIKAKKDHQKCTPSKQNVHLAEKKDKDIEIIEVKQGSIPPSGFNLHKTLLPKPEPARSRG